LVHAIPYYAIKQGLLTTEKKNKRNIFSGRILEIEGLQMLKAEQAFELADASAERSAAACVLRLEEENVAEYLRSNATLLRWMISQGYQHAPTLEKRIAEIEAWLANPSLLSADENAEYAAIIDIDLTEITEPIVCAPNDPDDARLLSEVARTPVQEVFIGSCMTNIGHFRAAGSCWRMQKRSLAACGLPHQPKWMPNSFQARVILISSSVPAHDRTGGLFSLHG
jgi:aconitate hydratase 2/2-methylisocitrate dehydratase